MLRSQSPPIACCDSNNCSAPRGDSPGRCWSLTCSWCCWSCSSKPGSSIRFRRSRAATGTRPGSISRTSTSRPTTAPSCTAGSSSDPNAKRAILYCHGNGENVGMNADVVAQLSDALDASVFIFDYRGYGHSEGTPNEAGCIADGLAAQRWLAERIGKQPSDIVVMGRSIGGAIATAVAAEAGRPGPGAGERLLADDRRRRAALSLAARATGDEESLRLGRADSQLPRTRLSKPRHRPTGSFRSVSAASCSKPPPPRKSGSSNCPICGHNDLEPGSLLSRAGRVSRRGRSQGSCRRVAGTPIDPPSRGVVPGGFRRLRSVQTCGLSPTIGLYLRRDWAIISQVQNARYPEPLPTADN